MFYGQWVGRINGSFNGKILVGVDKIMEDKQGAISIMPTDGDTFPAIARLTFTDVGRNVFKGNLDMFLGFTK